ncbi:Methyl-accepting chemotaxis sensor/transducer protein [hydrothermal vent metagenome]|uniref:Methyl-accepting chemotaxis sensor/transducer protein n=1 Tax=hydrothermal vent metagenome TaxID=652676 RepID=A0A3B0WLS0_9ZZZZ
MFGATKQKIKILETENQSYKHLMTALNHSLAIIEFDPSGHVLTANENFLKTIGYSLPEIQGKHHRLFVSETEQKSLQYQAFWEKLAQGNAFTGQFSRIGKDAKQIWIEASYNPIKNEKGQVYKIIKLASDITQKIHAELESKAKLSAINQTYAVIEFDPSGQILTANENFCHALGYPLEEIKSQHHRIFVDSEETSKPEYQAFWQALSQGKEQTGVFKRISKQGKDIWIQAAYIPVAFEGQQPHKIIKIAADITEQKQNEIELAKLVEEASVVLQSVSKGVLTQKIYSCFSDKLECLKQNINQSVHNQAQALSSISEATSSVLNSANEVTIASQGLSQRTQEIVLSVEQTSEKMDTILNQVQSTHSKIQEVKNSTTEQQDLIQSGTKLMDTSLNAMEKIKSSSEEITSIVTLIDTIAFQTNLLALNAAVEAARAGEHGRGFAVVAGEVRNLAQKSAEASKSIKTLIEQSVQQSQDGVSIVLQLSEKLDSIKIKSGEVVNTINSVGALAQEQIQSIDAINTEITNIDASTQENAAFVEQASATAENLSERAQDVQEILSQFVLPDHAELKQLRNLS